ncbi:MAG: cupin domain-containing protein [Thermocrispum sp.]
MTEALGAANLDDASDIRVFELGSMRVVAVGDHVVGKAVFEPGWRWSDHVRPVVGTDTCEQLHVGCILSGQLAIRMVDGTEAVAGPGDVFVVPPGHDGWVVGNQACVMLDWAGSANYAR